MTPDEIATNLKVVTMMQAQLGLRMLEQQEHQVAVEAVLLRLDGRAMQLLEERLKIEHEKNRERREQLEILIQSNQSGSVASRKPN